MLTMKVFRKVADPNFYMAVGHDGPRPLAPSLLNTFPTSIPVSPGDIIGNNSGDGTACFFTVPGESNYFKDGDLADGQSGGFTLSASNLRLNITAVFVPSNTFTLGAITRDKKKGTATLTANVPNPGELTGSGNGVSAAGAAGTSRAVSAPGEVQLLIEAKGKKKKKLKRKGKVTVNPTITYTPTGGDPSSQSIEVKLKKTLKKR